MGPDTWGPHGWKFIHYVTLGYPNNPSDDIKEKYRKLIPSAQAVGELAYTNHKEWIVNKPYDLVPNYISPFEI